MLLLQLILAHLIGDFLLQPKDWIEDKVRKKIRSVKLLLHILVHIALAAILTWDLSLLPYLILLGILHYGIDLLKLYASRPGTMAFWWVADQLLHIVTIVALYCFIERPELSWTWVIPPEFYVYGIAVVLLSYPSSMVIKYLLAPWTEKHIDGPDDSLPNAGMYIGIIERLLVLIFIATGHWEAVGFLIAAKSIFRFGDLRESRSRKLTEYFLIGTLLSMGIAILISLAAVYLSWVL